MKRIFALLLVFSLTIFLLAQALGFELVQTWLVPQPDRVAQNFVSQLNATRYDKALEELNAALRNEEGARGLEQLGSGLQAKFGAYALGLEGETQRKGTRARYAGVLETQLQGSQEIEFELERNHETQRWEISTLNHLKQLAQP